ncbi:GNAT family N-acetyltransferase [Rhizobium sp. C4]|uniref:GNAT family N-acetyltransferase n=1 Tax=Rhizobium sp. C4 TaxID=1349800 RepID=UPI001E3EBCE2|nr:GNAT family protein [Rhizobium sp. C4]MCD2172737.1 GNAT family N-acetyltransferase [Rhizobium sp. C4]
MNIRPATLSDLPAIMAIERTEGFDAYVGRSERAQHEALMAAADCRYLMLEDETGAAGFAILQGVGAANGVVYLKRIAIRSPGKGFGKRFLSALIRLSFDDYGAEKFWLDAFETNARARHVYTACGLQLDGVLREHYPLADGTRANLVVMSILKREWVEIEARRQSRLVAEADARDAETAEFMDAAFADLARSDAGKDV